MLLQGSPKRVDPKHGGFLGQESATDLTYVFLAGGGPRGIAMYDYLKWFCPTLRGVHFAGAFIDNKNIPKGCQRYVRYKQYDPFEDLLLERAVADGLPRYYDSISPTYQVVDGLSFAEQWMYRDALQVAPGTKVKMLIVMACYGQRWRNNIIHGMANGWFLNSHPVRAGSPWDVTNPDKGASPWETMCRDNIKWAELVWYFINEQFDAGELELCRSRQIALPQYSGKQMQFVRDGNKIKRIYEPDQGPFVLGRHEDMAVPCTESLGYFLPSTIVAIQAGLTPQQHVMNLSSGLTEPEYGRWTTVAI